MRRIITLACALAWALVALCGCDSSSAQPDTGVNQPFMSTATSALKPTECSHSWDAASCLSPKSCRLCGKSQGTVLPHNYEKGVCTMCGAADPKWAEIQQVLRDIERWPTYVEINVDILDTKIEICRLTGSVRDANEIVETVSDMISDIQKIVDACCEYPELESFVNVCLIDTPDTSSVQRLIATAQSFSNKARRIPESYRAYCEIYDIN
ncbi:MAG: hypothetical protein IJZ13_01745 [Clostridia bacterium]|nr:hypothetical protein [Clostridia bacterium]